MPRRVAQKVLEERLGYRFRDRALLGRALTHASSRVEENATPHDNERLEFLGDRVLGLVIAELLCELFPQEQEGDLARRFNRMVRKETCAAVGRELELGPHLVLSDSEHTSGGRDKDTILGDACEAVLGAVFQDGGFEKTRALIRRLWQNKIGDRSNAHADPKTALQEWAQGLEHGLPAYREISRSGPPHAPEFTSEVRVGHLPPERGVGSSKRAAEQAAAMAMLRREGIWENRVD